MLVVACGPAARKDGGDDDDSGAPDATAIVGDGSNGDCANGTELVYTIDQAGARFARFDPQTKMFEDLGALSCPATGGALPFSMSVDRAGFAWVLYNNGELFKVSVNNLAGCTKTAWTTQQGLRVFGMGFSTDVAGGSSETLYIGGGQTQTQSSYTLAKLDLQSLTATPVGSQTQLPEMTGTGNAELWGFMPEATTARIVKFDKTTGAALTTYTRNELAGTGSGYAFAHWGGDFWVFLYKSGQASTTVYQIDGATGALEGMTPATGRTIVGAGVSTCAPVVVF